MTRLISNMPRKSTLPRNFDRKHLGPENLGKNSIAALYFIIGGLGSGLQLAQCAYRPCFKSIACTFFLGVFFQTKSSRPEKCNCTPQEIEKNEIWRLFPVDNALTGTCRGVPELRPSTPTPRKNTTFPRVLVKTSKSPWTDRVMACYVRGREKHQEKL